MSYIGNEPIVSATRTVTEITATAGQTTFTANGGYTVGYIDVFVNGAQLQTSDFTATSGTSITLNQAATVGDDIRLVAWGTFSTANLNGSSLVDGTVSTAKLANSSVTSAKIADSSVTQAKLATGVSGTGPAFSAYRSSAQTFSNGTATKVQFNVETFDTANCFDPTTNYRFTPNVAGYYYFSGCCTMTVTIGGNPYVNGYIYKNGSAYARTPNSQPVNGNYISGSCNAIVYLNGSTDYVEFYAEQASAGTGNIVTGSDWTWFCGVLVRAA